MKRLLIYNLDLFSYLFADQALPHECNHGGAQQQLYYQFKFFQASDIEVAVVVASEQQHLHGKHDFGNQAFVYVLPRANTRQGFKTLYPWFKQIAPTHVFVRSYDSVLLDVYLISKFLKFKLIYQVGSTMDVNYRLVQEKMANLATAALFYLGLWLTKSVVVQTNEQQQCLKKYFLKSSLLVRSIADTPLLDELPDEFSKKEVSGKLQVLWVGSLSGVKNVDAFFELATQVKQAKQLKQRQAFEFVIIGRTFGEQHQQSFLAKVSTHNQTHGNITYLGPLEHNALLKQLSTAFAVVQTSFSEGFSNVLLEAWGYGVPTLVQYFDTDSLVSKHQLGAHCPNIKTMAKVLQHWQTNPQEYRQICQNAFDFVRHEFSSNKTLHKLFELVNLG